MAVRIVKRVGKLQFDNVAGGGSIKRARVEAEMTQEQVAVLMGISPKELSRLETASTDKVSFETAIRLSLCLDVPLQEIAEWYGVSGLRAFLRK